MAKMNLSNGSVALVDDADLPLLHGIKLWTQTTYGRKRYTYVGFRRRGKAILLHRFLMQAPPGTDVDHINGNGLDNRRRNLRLATRSENIANQKPRPGKFKGVYRASSGSYCANISFKGKTLHIGHFATAEEAARAFDHKAVEIFGPFANLNFPKI